MKTKREIISVVVPVHNEQDNVVPLIAELHAVLKTVAYDFEIIVVDDGSRDRTFELLEVLTQKYPELRALQLRTKSGQSSALQAGFDSAQGQIIATMDGDLQNDPKDFVRLLEKIEEGYDFATGWRKDRQDKTVTRKLPSWIANALIRGLTSTRFRDLGCSLKMFRSEVLKEVRLYGEMHRVLGILVHRLGFRTCEVPVNHRMRVHGRSKYGLRRTYKVVLDVLLINFLRNYRSNPLHFFGGLAIWCFGFSALGILGAGAEKLIEGTRIHHNPLFAIGLVLGVAGLQLALMGFLAEMMVRNYFESTSIKTYAVKRVASRKPEKASREKLKRVA